MIANEREDAAARETGLRILSEVEVLAAPFITALSPEAADSNRAVALIDAVLLAVSASRHPAIVNGIAIALGSYVGQCDAKKGTAVMRVLEMGLNAGVQRANRELAVSGRPQ